MKRRTLTLTPRSGPRLTSQTTAALPDDEDETSDGHLPRGVWRAPYRLSGYPVLIVVDAHGWRRLEVPILCNMDESVTWRELEAWLDIVDPLPKKRDERTATPTHALRLVQ